MVKSVVLAWGSLLWDPRDLETAAEFVANGPLLPIEFCRISADGRLTLAIDETFGSVCKTYSAPSALDSLDAAIENLRLREGMPNSRAVGFVEPASGRQSHSRHGSASAGCRDDRRLGRVAWLRRRDLDRAHEQLRCVGQGRRAVFRHRGASLSRNAGERGRRQVRPRADLYPQGAGRGRDAGARGSLQALAWVTGSTVVGPAADF